MRDQWTSGEIQGATTVPLLVA